VRLLKILGFTVGALMLLVLLLVAAVALLFDPNDYKAQLQRAVEQRTGRRLQLDGDLRLAWFPWLAVEFGPAALGNAPGFGTEPMLQVQRARLGVRVSALLLRRRLEFDTVRIDEPVLRLAVDAAGRDNWTGLSGDDAAAARGPGTPLPPLSFSSIRIADGRLEYRDARDASTTELRGLALETGRVQAGAPFDVETRFQWRSAADSSIDVGIGGRAALDLDANRYRLESPRIDLRLRGAAWPAEGLPVSIRSGPIDVDLEAQTLRLPALQAESLGARLSGEIAARQLLDSPRFSGPLRLAPMSLRDWASRAGIALPAMRDPKALGELSFDGELSATPEAFELGDLTLRLDGASMTGTVGIADLDTNAIRFELAADELDLNRYLPPKAAAPASAGAAAAQTTRRPGASNAAAAVSPGESRAVPVELPTELLRDLDLVGVLTAKTVRVAGVPLSGLKLGINAQQSKLRLQPFEAGLYGGRYRGDLRVDATDELPRVDFEQTLTAIDFAPLLRDLMDSRRLSGRGTGSATGTARGRDLDALLRSAQGEVRLQVADGAIEGTDLWYEIRRARALLRREPVPARPAGAARTPFTRLQATGRLGDGALRSDDVAMDLQYLRVAGRGKLDLVTLDVDWNLDARVLKIPADDTAATAMQDVVDFTIPIKVTGPIDNPTVRPDLEGLAKTRVKQELEKRRDDLENKVKDKLRDLFKR
jgi:AsmA protein